MNNMSNGVISRGIKAPMIKEGDDLVNIIVDSVINEVKNVTVTHIPYYIDGVRTFNTEEHISYDINDKDIIGITESVIARAAGQYISVDDIAEWIIKKFGPDAELIVDSPIYSRNRFSMILKGIARAAKKIYFIMPPFDEVGNPSGVNPFTGVDIQKYYAEICSEENCESEFGESVYEVTKNINDYDIDNYGWIYCGLHNYNEWKEKHTGKIATLADVCKEFSPDWGVLGTNKSTEERLKLFPSKEVAQKVCDEVKAQIKEITGKDVIVCSYGDGCFKDPVGGIWEFADPVTMPAYTDKELIESTPNEIKLKAFIDDGTSEEEINKLIKEKKDLKGSMTSQGTTPRLYRDLLASLMDLTSGSGDRATPIVLIQNYFRD